MEKEGGEVFAAFSGTYGVISINFLCKLIIFHTGIGQGWLDLIDLIDIDLTDLGKYPWI